MNTDHLMITFLKAFALNTWYMVAEMAPYLIFGFAIAGLLHILIRKEQVQRLLGKPGLGAVFKACLIGVPMPLCSCSVIPVAAALHKSGASRGATAAFLSSTPQTGVDSMLATYSLMGGLFATVRVVVAFVSGIVTGFLIELFCNNRVEDSSPASSLSPNLTPNPNPQSTPSKITSMIKTPQASALKPQVSSPQPSRLSTALRYGFINLPADLAAALLVGLALAGLITTLLPPDLISGHFSTGPLAFLLATAISLPLYICATASIPMAYALMAAGLSPGAALIFLIAGPATNTATIITLWKMLGHKATLIYLGSLIVIAWIAGWLLNSTLGAQTIEHSVHQHTSMQPEWWQHLSGIVLILILLISCYLNRTPKPAAKACCCD
jgi:uncharacterized membrane protein YraQ (UPF0718 family)